MDLFHILGNPMYYLFQDDRYYGHSTLLNLFGQDEDTIDELIDEIDAENEFNFRNIMGKIQDFEVADRITTCYYNLLNLLAAHGTHDFHFIDSIGQLGSEINPPFNIDPSNIILINTKQSFEKSSGVELLDDDSESVVSEDEKSSKNIYELIAKTVSGKTELGKEINNMYSSGMFKSYEALLRNWYTLDFSV